MLCLLHLAATARLRCSRCSLACLATWFASLPPPCLPVKRGQVWMEHRYLVNRQDLQERPGWAAAVQVRAHVPTNTVGRFFVQSVFPSAPITCLPSIRLLHCLPLG